MDGGLKCQRSDLIEPELSFKIIGSMFQVYNELGPGLHEKYYQKAASAAFKNQNLSFQEQVHIPLSFSGEIVGRYFADFIVENKIVVELKIGNQINRKHAKQIFAYLKSKQISLGILVYFGKDTVFFKRIINQQ